MKWLVYNYDINRRKVQTFNIFEGGSVGFAKCLKEHARKCVFIEEFADKVKDDLRYYYWSKCEWEVLVTPWVGGNQNEGVKIDVFDQIMNAWEPFIEYCWAHKKELSNE